MDKILHVASTFKSHEVEDGSVMIRGMASTDHSDRAGDVIAAEAWTKGGLENFKNNPVILFNHDYNKPIGRATGVNVTKNGLELEAKISKAAKDVCDLVKDGVLGAFSVGFKVKDADYVKETDGLMIKDAELFEVSVVSVPCNQAATFSLAKSFDSVEEYEAFKKTFTNRVDLTGQSLTSKDSIESNVVSDAPKQVEKSTVKETKMSEDTKTPEIDLEAFAKKVADETAAKIAMKQAETKAAEEAEAKAAAEAEAEKAAQEEQVKKTIRTGIETGAEKLMADVQADLEKASSEQIAEVTAKYEAQLKEKADELEQMRQSKRSFSDRSGNGQWTKADRKELVNAHILGQITGKGWDTAYGREVTEKLGVDNVVSAINVEDRIKVDASVSTTFEEEVKQEQKIAPLFREIAVQSGATVLPINPEVDPATFSSGGLTKDLLTGDIVAQNRLEDSGASDGNFSIKQVVLRAHRLISGTFIDNDTDEQVLISLLPMIQSSLARAHAIAIDKAILVGASSGLTTGLVGASGTDDTNGFSAASAFVIDASTDNEIAPVNLLNARKEMGKYGINPSDVTYILPNDGYYELIDASGFTDVTEVGSDLATKLTGQVGSVFGSPVIVTDQLAKNLGATGAATTTAGLAVYTPGYVIPRLRGVNIETDYEVTMQRTGIVASQSLGFNELVAGDGSGNEPCIRIAYA